MKSKQTKRGVYPNISDSTFIVTDGKINFFFSSASKMGKFIAGYHGHRETLLKRLNKVIVRSAFPYEAVADIMYYENIQNKDGYATLNGKVLNDEELELYGVECMRKQIIPEYYPIVKPDDIEDVRSCLE